MGAGPNFSFEYFQFAKDVAFLLQDGIYFPNPFGLIALKQKSYVDEPVKRKKDFADIVELTSGFVENGTHFEMTEADGKH